MQRVIEQGDVRPMKNRPDAMAELKALLRARAPLYAQADHLVDTSLLGIGGSVDLLARVTT
jgi:XRE family aerobic/anaerobic benzoate catabolism transcriptional regulator